MGRPEGRRNMWEIPRDKLTIDLPEGFRLFEDEDSLYLYYGEVEVAKFSVAGVKVSEIEKAAQDYLAKMQKN